MKYITLALSLLTTINVIGQNLKKIDYNLDIGTTTSIHYKSMMEIMPGFENNPKTYFSVGIGYFFDYSISYNITKKHGITSGLNYNMINVKINDKVGLFESRGNEFCTYLHLPLMFNYKLSKKMTISTGIFGGYLISAKEKGTQYFDISRVTVDGITYTYDQEDPIIASINAEKDYDNNIKNDYKKYDFGLSAKISHETRLNSKLSSIVSTKFNYGLIPIMVKYIVQQMNGRTLIHWLD